LVELALVLSTLLPVHACRLLPPLPWLLRLEQNLLDLVKSGLVDYQVIRALEKPAREHIFVPFCRILPILGVEVRAVPGYVGDWTSVTIELLFICVAVDA